MGLVFEWDARKALANEQKHGVSFDEARTVFGDVHAITMDDVDHLNHEVRLLQLGTSRHGQLVVVVFTERNDRIRIISARRNEGRKATV